MYNIKNVSSIKTTPIMNEINYYNNHFTIKIPRSNARHGITYYGCIEDLVNIDCYEIIVANQKGDPFTASITYLLLKLPDDGIVNGVKYAKINMYKNGKICFDTKSMKYISKVFDKLDRDIITGFCTKYKESLEYMSHADVSYLWNYSILFKAKHFTVNNIPKCKKNRTDDCLIGSKLIVGVDPAVFSAIQVIRCMKN